MSGSANRFCGRMDESSVVHQSLGGDDAFGIRVLGKGVNPRVDVVAVHGLNGHREESWTACNGKLWLRDFLPEEVPTVRVLSYGYDCRTHSSEHLTHQILYEHAKKLLEALWLFRRRSRTERRPIIFVAHGLGGVVVKSALVHADFAGRDGHVLHYKTIKLCTSSVVFFGTPHRGGNGMTLCEILRNMTSQTIDNPNDEKVLKKLEKNLEWLEKQVEQYDAISGEFETILFYESRLSVLNGGCESIIVPQESAVIPCATGTSGGIMLDKDHTAMVRFSEKLDADFQSVSTSLFLLCEEASIKVRANWAKEDIRRAVEMDQKEEFSIPLEVEPRRNPNFTGRSAVLKNIHEIFGNDRQDNSMKFVVIHATEATGKTQVALEYLFSHQAHYSSIFWVNAESLESTRKGFVGIAKQLVRHYGRIMWDSTLGYSLVEQKLRITGLVGQCGGFVTEPVIIDQLIDAVKRWLARKENCRWLLVLDNFDDYETFGALDFLPADCTGHVIISSQHSDCTQYGHKLHLEKMGESDSIDLLWKISSENKHESEQNEKDQNEAREFVEKLGYLPIAIDYAASYIRMMKISIQTYLSLLDENMKALYNKIPPTDVVDHHRTVFSTLEISFSAVEKVDLIATELLLICSFFSSECIAEDILVRGLGHLDGYSALSISASVGTLLSFSLVTRTQGLNSFSIHPLVHHWTRKRLDPETTQLVAKKALCLLSNVLSSIPADHNGNPSDWADEKQTMLHVHTCSTLLNKIFFENPTREKSISLKSKKVYYGFKMLGSAYFYHSRNEEALVWFERALEGFEASLGKFHRQALDTVHHIANIYQKQQLYGDALRCYERVLVGSGKDKGMENPSIIDAVYNMAIVCAKQDQYQKALELYEKALVGSEKIMGKNHPSTLDTVYNMAYIYTKQDLHEKALELYERVLSGRENTLGRTHPATLEAANNMAVIHGKQRHYRIAIKLYERVLLGKEISLGKEHPSTLDAVYNMACIYNEQALYDKALKLHERALIGRKKVLGKSHPSTLTAIYKIANVYSKKELYEDALKWHQKALSGREKTLGKEHLSTLDSVYSVAYVYNQQGLYEKALEFYETALSGSEIALGGEHSLTLDIIYNMANIYAKTGAHKKALQYYERTLTGSEKALGEEHPSTLDTVYSIAHVHNQQGDYVQALTWYTRALHGRQRIFGNTHISTIDAVYSLAYIYTKQGQYDTALLWYQRALFGLENSFGEEHSLTLDTVSNMAFVYRKLMKYELALKWYERALIGRERALGEKHTLTMETAANMAYVYRKLHQYDKALMLYERSSPVRREKGLESEKIS